MQENGIIDDVIKSKCRKRDGCCLCNKRNTRPYVIPEREIIETLYTVTTSFEVFKAVKAFWLCDEHYALVKRFYEGGGKTPEMDRVIDGTHDITLLTRIDQMIDVMADTTEKVKSCVSQIREQTS